MRTTALHLTTQTLFPERSAGKTCSQRLRDLVTAIANIFKKILPCFFRKAPPAIPPARVTQPPAQPVPGPTAVAPPIPAAAPMAAAPATHPAPAPIAAPAAPLPPVAPAAVVAPAAPPLPVVAPIVAPIVPVAAPIAPIAPAAAPVAPLPPAAPVPIPAHPAPLAPAAAPAAPLPLAALPVPIAAPAAPAAPIAAPPALAAPPVPVAAPAAAPMAPVAVPPPPIAPAAAPPAPAAPPVAIAAPAAPAAPIAAPPPPAAPPAPVAAHPAPAIVPILPAAAPAAPPPAALPAPIAAPAAPMAPVAAPPAPAAPPVPVIALVAAPILPAAAPAALPALIAAPAAPPVALPLAPVADLAGPVGLVPGAGYASIEDLADPVGLAPAAPAVPTPAAPVVAHLSLAAPVHHNGTGNGLGGLWGPRPGAPLGAGGTLRRHLHTGNGTVGSADGTLPLLQYPGDIEKNATGTMVVDRSKPPVGQFHVPDAVSDPDEDEKDDGLIRADESEAEEATDSDEEFDRQLNEKFPWTPKVRTGGDKTTDTIASPRPRPGDKVWVGTLDLFELDNMTNQAAQFVVLEGIQTLWPLLAKKRTIEGTDLDGIVGRGATSFATHIDSADKTTPPLDTVLACFPKLNKVALDVLDDKYSRASQPTLRFGTATREEIAALAAAGDAAILEAAENGDEPRSKTPFGNTFATRIESLLLSLQITAKKSPGKLMGAILYKGTKEDPRAYGVFAVTRGKGFDFYLLNIYGGQTSLHRFPGSGMFRNYFSMEVAPAPLDQAENNFYWIQPIALNT